MVFLYGSSDFTNYRSALQRAGLPCYISPYRTALPSLLLPGGGDIHGALDERERQVIEYYVAHRRPILGICRGMQARNVYFGGTLHGFIPNHQHPDGDIFHPTCATDLAAELLGERPTVNSNHHQAVDTLGQELIPCQWSGDGLIEAFRHRSLPIFATQYHPERMIDGDAIFQWFAKEIHK